MVSRTLIRKLLCVGVVAAVMLPAGSMIFPYLSEVMSRLEFQAIEAVLGATLGLGISGLLS
jgi:hypothetical protein